MTPQEAFDIINASGTHRCLDLRERYAQLGIAEWWAVYRPEDDYDLMDFLTDEQLVEFAQKLEARE